MIQTPEVCKECIVIITCEQLCEKFILLVEKESFRDPQSCIPSFFASSIVREHRLCKNCGRADWMTFHKWKFVATICRRCGLGMYKVKYQVNNWSKAKTIFFDWKPSRRRENDLFYGRPAL